MHQPVHLWMLNWETVYHNSEEISQYLCVAASI